MSHATTVTTEGPVDRDVLDAAVSVAGYGDRAEAQQPGWGHRHGQLRHGAGADEKIATDGQVVEGGSAVDVSLLTGESIPVEVGPATP